MGKNYTHLTPEEREAIAHLQREGKTLRQIGTTLDRSASSISRELKRNSQVKGYNAYYAQERANARRWTGSRLERQAELRDAVLDNLAMGLSPEQVANRLAQQAGCSVISYESIYRFIDSQIKRKKDYSWRHYLPQARAKRGRRKKQPRASQLIKHRVSIHERPAFINQRLDVGHWEADLMLFSQYGQAVLAVHERHSRLMLLIKLKNKSAKPIAEHLTHILTSLPKSFAQSITFDNGSEFAQHNSLRERGISTFFCDTQSPWQKGGIENAIGRMRRFLPRNTDLNLVSQKQIEHLAALYNHIPRKCLNYKTPAEVFLNKLLHFKCESTFPPTRE